MSPASPSASEFASNEFDFIIIGGGTAGLALASRLSEEPSFQVGVIEAGGYDPDEPRINIPGHFGRIIRDPALDWGFVTVPQKELNGRASYFPRAKVLGGTSALNFMMLQRPSSVEYDAFEALGNNGWNAKSIFKSIRQSESLRGDKSTYDAKNHGTSGPISKSVPTWTSGLHQPFLDALHEFGIEMNPDPASGNNIGSQVLLNAINPKNSRRSYVTNEYFEPASHRPNLVVLTSAHVCKIRFSPKNGQDGEVTATGVEFIKDGVRHFVHAKKEVILSAGVFQTPQVLELSGIGDPKILDKFGIPVQVALPDVGSNLQDHAVVYTTFEVDSSLTTFDSFKDPVRGAEQLELYQTKGQGVLSNGASTAGSFTPLQSFVEKEDLERLKSKLESIKAENVNEEKRLKLLKNWFTDERVAQLELILIPTVVNAPGFTPSSSPDKCYMTIFSSILHPFSSGSVHISSSDPLAYPTIDPRYLNHDIDLDVLELAMKFVRKVCTESAAVKRVGGAKLIEDGNEKLNIRDFVRKKMWTVSPVGTASMRPRSDGGVVSEELRVYGTTNLRIVDTSVIPFQLSCFNSATAYGIAERASEMIKATYGAE